MLTRTCARCGGEFALPANVHPNDYTNPRFTHCNDCRVSIESRFLATLGN